MKIYEIQEITNIYVDAIVANEHSHLLFLSAWGLDTAIQEFIAKLSISKYEGGLDNFCIRCDEDLKYYRVLNVNTLVKHTGRASKDTLFNGLVHIWLHDNLATQIDRVNRRCLLLKQQTENADQFYERLWHTVRAICTVPLLPEWRHLVEDFQQKEWIKCFRGINVDAYQLDFSSSDVESFITDCIQTGKLTLPKKTNHLSLVA